MRQSKVNCIKPLTGKIYEVGSRVQTTKEQRIQEISFNIYKCNNRPKPSRKNVVIFNLFSEFGSLTVGSCFSIPKLIQEKYSGRYTILCTWSGLEYLFKHIVDEIWSLDSKYSYFKEYSRAFHHNSTNLKRLECLLDYYGNVVPINEISLITLKQIYTDIEKSKKTAVLPPAPSQEKIELIQRYLKPKSVAIFARGRKTYGRCLKNDFYKKLISLLQSLNYNPVWCGDSTSQECPADIIDFSKTEESKDLECTFALIKNCISLQFYTASHRISSMVMSPAIILETFDQMLGSAQEGIRQSLFNFSGKNKLVISDFWSTYYNEDRTLALIKECLQEIENNDFTTKIGLCENPDYIKFLIDNEKRYKI